MLQTLRIGTDFIEGEVNVINEVGNEQNMHIKSENDLKALLKNLEGNVFYFDIAAASKNDELSAILHNPQKMISIGNELSSWQKISSLYYTVTDIPADNYNGIIIFKTVTPTQRKPVPEG